MRTFTKGALTCKIGNSKKFFFIGSLNSFLKVILNFSENSCRTIFFFLAKIALHNYHVHNASLLHLYKKYHKAKPRENSLPYTNFSEFLLFFFWRESLSWSRALFDQKERNKRTLPFLYWCKWCSTPKTILYNGSISYFFLLFMLFFIFLIFFFNMNGIKPCITLIFVSIISWLDFIHRLPMKASGFQFLSTFYFIAANVLRSIQSHRIYLIEHNV